MKTTVNKLIQGIMTALAAAALLSAAGCSLFTDQTTELSGAVSKGPVAEATVTVYALNSDGIRGDVIASANTDSDGSYTVEISRDAGPVAVVSTSGSYTDEATGQNVDVGDDEEMETLLADTEEGTTVAVTALTTIAAERAAQQAAKGLETAITAANREVRNEFGLPAETDISGVVPSDLTQSSASQDSEAAQAYGAVLGGLSQVAADANVDPNQVLTMVQDMAKDFEDGEFNGQDAAGDALSNATSLAPSEAVNGLNTAVSNFLNGDQNQSGITALSGLGISF